MASKRRIRRKSCVSKVQYADFVSAQMAGWKRTKASKSSILPYKCAFGGHWHIGHPPANVRQSIRAHIGLGII